MKNKLLIFICIITLIFCVYRIHFENKNKSVGLFLEYRNFISHLYEHESPEKFIDKLKKNKVLNVFATLTTVSDLVYEYNEVILMSGMKLNLLFNSNKFNNSNSYLIIPNRFNYIIEKIDIPLSKIKHKNYIVFETAKPISIVKNFVIVYKRKYEDVLKKNNIIFLRIKNKPVLKGIDYFILQKGLQYFLIDKINTKSQKIIKVHKFSKLISKPIDIAVFINENYRAVIERNVNGIIIPTLKYNYKNIDLDRFLPLLNKKLEKRAYNISDISKLSFVYNKNIFLLYKIILLITAGLLILIYFSSSRLYIILIIGILSVVKFSLIYIILTFLFFYMLNNYILKLHKKNMFNIKSFFVFLLFIFLGVLSISGFLISKETFYYSQSILGIKFVFLLPLIMWIIQYIQFKKIRIKNIFNKNINITQYSIITFIIILLPFLILRSGNYSLPVSGLELKIRYFLENIFYIRPRFKEIFFYPFVFLLFFTRKYDIIKSNFFVTVFFIFIAVSTTMNSFLHIHTLCFHSFIRTLIGMSMGFIIACFAVILYYLMEVFNRRKKRG